MAGGNRSQDDKVQDWILPVIGILIALAIAWGIGQLQARETYKRQHIPTAYAEAAKKDAERTCIGTEPSIVFKCVNEKVETAYQTAHDEQDLSAQQRAASSALLTTVFSFMALVLSAVGVWFVKRTLDATLEAVKDTSKATLAMESQNTLAREVMERQLRAYLTSSDFKTRRRIDQNNRFIDIEIQAIVHNSGQTPALLEYGILDIRIVELEAPIPDHEISIGITPPLNSTIGGGLYGTAGSQRFPREVIELAFEGRINIILYVGIGYKDVFQKFHETRYVMHARPLFHPTAFEQNGGDWRSNDFSPDAFFEYAVIHGRGSFT